MLDLLGVGGQLLGTWMTNQANERIAGDATQFSAHQAQLNRQFQGRWAQRQMDFQKYMSGHAHRREVKDLRKAGLNPILSGTGGMGSASAAGAAAHGAQAEPHTYKSENVIGPAVATALEIARTVSTLKSQEQDRNIKKPVEGVAESAAKTVQDVKDVVKPISEKVSEVVNVIRDKLEEGTLSSAAAVQVERAVGAVKELAKEVGERVAAPVKAVAEAASSAKREAERAVGEAIHGKRGVKVPESKGKVPREAQGRIRRHEWKFNYTP